jgi:hypothetical protein
VEGERVTGWVAGDEVRVPTPVVFRRLLAVAAALGVLAIAWLGFALISPLDLPFQRVEATMTPRVSVAGTTARVEGTTTLPDGAVIYYEYWHADDAVTAPDDAHGGTATVRDGRFAFSTDLSDWPAGRVTRYTAFRVGWGFEQPQDVVALFGSEGEHMSGPQVYVDSPGDPKVLVVLVDFELGSGQPAS